MKRTKTLLTAGVITAFSVGLAYGQAGQPGQPQQDHSAMQQQQQEEFQTFRSSDLKGSRVVNPDGDRLGTLEDFTVELEDGTLSYTIVASGGFLGVGAEWHPVPPESFEIREVALGYELVLDITEDQWEQAPTIDRERVDDLAMEDRGQRIYEFYGADWEAREQRIQEFAAPDRDRDLPGFLEESDDSAQVDEEQIREQIEQAMTQAGVDENEAREEAHRLAQEISTERPDQEEIEQKVEQALTSAGVDSERAEQEAERLSEQLHQQIEFAAPDRDRNNNEYGAPDEERNQLDEQQQDQEYGIAPRDREMAQSKIHLGSDVTDLNVFDRQNEEIGQVNDMLVSLEEGRVAFVLFTEGTGLFAGDEEFAVAPQALEIRDEQAILNITERELQQAQLLHHHQVHQHARELAGIDMQQAREQPRVFRYQDTNGAIFGAPERDREVEEEEKPELEHPQHQQY